MIAERSSKYLIKGRFCILEVSQKAILGDFVYVSALEKLTSQALL